MATPLDEQRTGKWQLQDRGVSLILLGLGAALVMWWAGMRRGEEWRCMRTPAHRASFYLAGFASVLCSWKLDNVELFLELGRHHHPWWADSIGIPLYYNLFFYAGLGLAAAAGMLMVLWRAKLPVPLWYWDAQRPVRCWAWTLIFALPFTLSVVLLVENALIGMGLRIPPGVVVLYLLLSARAIMAAKDADETATTRMSSSFDAEKVRKASA